MSQVLSVPVFGGGIVLEGSSDAQRTDELQACDSLDIGPRGQLIVASDLTAFINAADAGTALTTIYGMEALVAPQAPVLAFVGGHGGSLFVVTYNLVSGFTAAPAAGTDPASGLWATFAAFPYVDTGGKQRRILLIAIGARPFKNPRDASGLYVISYDSGTGLYTMLPISSYDALGTGASGEFAGGSKAVQLYPRIVVPYNNHAFLLGFDNHDATTGDGPNRVMFSNAGNPLKYGNDNLGAVGSDRFFTDSDAFNIGGAGESIRSGYVWNGRLWVATNQQLNYIEGYARESFLTNGAIPIRRSRNAIGPHAMIEGPDSLLYGVSDDGLWAFDGSAVDPVGNKLRNFARKSPGYWDLIWTDTSRTLAAYPGQSNQDLVWMLSDTDNMQVWVIIPYCSAANGYGFGADTVILKYSVLTGGFTRQVFTNTILTHGAVLKRDAAAGAQRFVCAPGLANNVQRYGYKATLATSPALPSALPDVTFGEYAPFGPDGVGVFRKRYLTIAWESAASTLGLVFSLTPTADGQSLTAVKLTISASTPGAPSNGDLWLDTSGTDTNIGNGTAGAIIPANAADYLLKRYITTWAKWVQVPAGGQQGRRVTLPIAFDYAVGTRFTMRCQCTAADRRFQIEGFAEKPAIVREAI